jgi:hypothetical protein
LCGGSCAEHWADAEPLLMLIITLEVVADLGALAFILMVVVPADVVVTLALTLLCTRPNVFACQKQGKQYLY